MVSIKELREKKNLSQKNIADLLDLSVTGYAGKESGYRQFKPHEAIKISDFFGIDIREISDFLPKYKRNTYESSGIA